MITGADPEQLYRLRPDQVDAQGGAVQLTVRAAFGEGGQHVAERCLYTIPTLALGIFRAALEYYRLNPARISDGFLAPGIGGDVEQLRASARACRIDLPALVVAQNTPEGHTRGPVTLRVPT
jgi:hypothetical protein